MGEIEKEIVNEIINNQWSVGVIMILILLLFFWFFFRHFSASFSSQKGKNLADKQDIQALTLKVEEVKLSFNEKIETIRAKLDLKKHLEVGHKSDARESLLTLHKSTESNISILTNVFSSVENAYNNEQINKALWNKNKIRTDYENDISRSRLYVQNEKLDEILLELSLLFNKYSKYFNEYFLIKQETNSQLDRIEKNPNLYDDDQFQQKTSAILEKRRQAESNWIQEHKKSVVDLFTLRKLLTEEIKQELNSLLEDY